MSEDQTKDLMEFLQPFSEEVQQRVLWLNPSAEKLAGRKLVNMERMKLNLK